MPQEIQQNKIQRVSITCGNIINKTTPTISLYKSDGSVISKSITNTVNWIEIDSTNMPGVYDLILTQTDTNTLGKLLIAVDGYDFLCDVVLATMSNVYSLVNINRKLISNKTITDTSLYTTSIYEDDNSTINTTFNLSVNNSPDYENVNIKTATSLFSAPDSISYSNTYANTATDGYTLLNWKLNETNYNYLSTGTGAITSLTRYYGFPTFGNHMFDLCAGFNSAIVTSSNPNTVESNTSSFSISLWVKLKSKTSYNNDLFGKYLNLSGTTPSVMLSVTDNTIPRFTFYGDSNKLLTVDADGVSGGTVPINEWCLLSAVYDNSICKLYLNGNLNCSTTVGKIPLSSIGNNKYTPTDSSTVLNWKFDETSGTTFAESINGVSISASSGGTNIVAGASGLFVTSGSIKKSVKFDAAVTLAQGGVNSGAGFLPPNCGTNCTISIWINPTILSGYRQIFYKAYRTDATWTPPHIGGIGLDLIVNQLGVLSNIGGTLLQVPCGLIQTNIWTFVAITFDGSFVRLYINGVLINSTARSGSLDWGTGKWIVGSNPVNTESFIGSIDDIRVESTTRSESYLLDMYNYGKGIYVDLPSSISYGDHGAWFVGGTNQKYVQPDSKTLINWKVNESIGTLYTTSSTVTDSISGIVLKPQAANSNISIVKGIVGNALDFNNSTTGQTLISDGLLNSINTVESYNVSTTLTLSCWVYARSTTGDIHLVGKRSRQDSAYPHWGTNLRILNNYIRYFEATSISHIDYTTTTVVPINTWVHLAATQVGTSIIVYMNGVVAGSATTNASNIWSTHGPWVIGGETTNSYLFNGMICDIRFENVVRDAAYLLNVYNSGIGNYNNTCNALISDIRVDNTARSQQYYQDMYNNGTNFLNQNTVNLI